MLAERAGRARPLPALLALLVAAACTPVAPPPHPREVVRTGTTDHPFITTTPETR
ncbi:hypothetical protein [Sphaerisporangium album]|uniref:hypothetical protein n=1 Tax=Sphaerisporangium album TaxID=509200 RepID=UPI0015F0744B|nr:hypothetical protein [Sphaerisporangium album]